MPTFSLASLKAWLFSYDSEKATPTGFKQCHYINFLDSAIINPALVYLSDLPIFHDILPNVISIAGLMIRIAGIIVYSRTELPFLKRLFVALAFVLGYFFDCLDGFIARKFNKCTNFGCILDHTIDILTMLAFVYFAVKKRKIVTVLCFLFLTFFAFNEFYIIEQYYTSESTIFFQMLTKIGSCFHSLFSGNYIHWFGISFWILIISLVILIE